MKKNQEIFHVKKNVSIDLFYRKETDLDSVISQIDAAVIKPLKYFNINKEINFAIELIYSRNEFDKSVGYKTEDWVSAHAFGDRFIIFDPERIEKLTSHKKSEFAQIVSHETSHILLKTLNVHFSTWMNEGLAQKLAGQVQNAKINSQNIYYFLSQCLFVNPRYEEFINHQGYEISFRLMNHWMQRYPKKDITTLLLTPYDFEKSRADEICKILNENEQNLVSDTEKILKEVEKQK